MWNKWWLISAVATTSAALAGDATPTGGPASANAKQQISVLLQAWADAEIHRDSAVLKRILDDRFIATFGSGAPLGKDAYIKSIVDDTSNVMSSETLSDETFIIDRDTAVTAGMVTIRGSQHGQPYTQAARYTVTYIHRDGRWVPLAEHFVEIKQK